MCSKRSGLVIILTSAILIVVAGIYSRKLWLAFIFVLIHEAIHIITARIIGYGWGKLKLLPFGTSAVLKDEFVRPVDDIIISASGPLTNFAFFCLFSLLSSQNNVIINVLGTSWSELGELNLALCLFNIFPAEFLDGGRIMKSLLKLYVGYFWSYVIVFCGGMLIGTVLVSGMIYYKLTINGIIIFSLGVYIFTITLKNKRGITLNIIKDEIYKQEYIRTLRIVKIVTIGVSENIKIVDVIKHFCFNRYYNVCFMKKGEIAGTINEKQLYLLYCSYGNITIDECITRIKTQEV